MKKIAIRIPERIADTHRDTYRTASSGVLRAAMSWPFLREACLKELHGFFDEDELDHLIELQRGLPFEPVYAAMIDTFALRLKQNPKDSALLCKVKALAIGQALILADWIDCYLWAEKKKPERLPELRKELI